MEVEAKSNQEYVQVVPDHCDRTLWRGRYIHLWEDM